MTGLNHSAPARAPAAARALQLTHHSTMREFVFEHLLLGQLGAELLARDVEYDVLRSEVDKEGFDILLEAGGVARHTQLKVKIEGGARAEITINTRLATKPSGCVIWLTYDPVERRFCSIRWFGNRPGQPLPDIGDRVARHTRANSQGIKAGRPNHRVVPARSFEQLDDFAHLADRLFGIQPTAPLAFLRSRLTPPTGMGPAWVDDVADGYFDAIPADISWEAGAIDLAHLIDGYRLLELISDDDAATFLARQQQLQAETGRWPGDAMTLWTTLFLQARADRFGPNDHSEANEPLDLLARQLRDALADLENADA